MESILILFKTDTETHVFPFFLPRVATCYYKFTTAERTTTDTTPPTKINNGVGKQGNERGDESRKQQHGDQLFLVDAFVAVSARSVM